MLCGRKEPKLQHALMRLGLELESEKLHKRLLQTPQCAPSQYIRNGVLYLILRLTCVGDSCLFFSVLARSSLLTSTGSWSHLYWFFRVECNADLYLQCEKDKIKLGLEYMFITKKL